VICDRFFDATVAYQGAARGQDMKMIRVLNERVTQGIQPDITFLLDCPVNVGLTRALKRNRKSSLKGQDRFEREKFDFHVKVREGYLELARENPERFVVIDASITEDGVADSIAEHMRSFLKCQVTNER